MSVIAPGCPRVKLSYQFAGEVGREGAPGPEGFAGARRRILEWAREKIPREHWKEIPEESWEGKPFRWEIPGQSLEVCAAPEEGAWALRLEQPDAPSPFGDAPAVPGRTWTTDLALRNLDGRVLFGCKVLCASLPYCSAPVPHTRPHILKVLAQEVGLRDIRPVRPIPWRMGSQDDLDLLQGFLLDGRRRLPVTLLTQPDPTEYKIPLREFVLDAEDLAARCVALSHIVLMPRDLGFEWTRRMGKRWSAYNGAVITYRPGMNLEEDPPSLHPKVLLDRILFWRHEKLEGERAFAAFLEDRARRFLAERPMAFEEVAFVPEVRVLEAEAARRRSTESNELLQLLLEENDALRARIEALEKEAEQYNDDALRAEREREAVAEENKRLRAALDALRASLAQKTGTDPDESLDPPDSYEDLPTWVSRELAGRLVLHPRAIQSLKKGEFEDPRLVGRCLLLLARDYRDERRGVPGARERLEEELEALHVRLSGSIDEARAGAEGEAYYVNYPPGTVRRRFLELHLRKGTSHDPRRTLAIYFFWDEETQQVVVGWLPGHLENRMT